MTIIAADLTSDEDWNALRIEIAPRRNVEALNGLLAYLREIGSKCVVVEQGYYDRDFTAEFSAFYSKVFKPYSKPCRRLHFFDRSVLQFLNNPNLPELILGLETISNTSGYHGFIVIRPVEHAPIGRAVLAKPISPRGTNSDVLVRSEFASHLSGATLKVLGTPFTQQDSRIGACAQASIWMAARHFQSKHGGPWVSTADITEAASKPTDHVLSSALPAGSAGLSVDNMLRALRSIGREPLIYAAQHDPASQTLAWPANLLPHRIIDRYVDSGIPVIIGLMPWTAGTSIWHAVVATGHNLSDRLILTTAPSRSTRADFCRHFLVHDDQHGINLRMPLQQNLPDAQSPYSLSNVGYLIIPLPSKVYISAEAAENVAWDFIERYCAEWHTLKATYDQHLGSSKDAGDRFIGARAANSLIARTYLTYGWRYRQRILRNICADSVKEVAAARHLPRYVWVTEFLTADSISNLDESNNSVFAHAVLDATSSNFEEGRCIVHAPGFVWYWEHDTNLPYAASKNTLTAIKDDKPYRMKIRGRI